jgi:hypothetical protein
MPLGYKKRNWWGEKALWGLTRNDLSLIAVAFVATAICFSTDWNWVFGLR